MTVGQGGNNLVYANSGGHGMLEDLKQMRRDRSILMAKVDKHQSQIVEHQSQIIEHQSQIDELEKHI